MTADASEKLHPVPQVAAKKPEPQPAPPATTKVSLPVALAICGTAQD